MHSYVSPNPFRAQFGVTVARDTIVSFILTLPLCPGTALYNQPCLEQAKVQSQWVGTHTFAFKAEVDFDGTFLAAKLKLNTRHVSVIVMSGTCVPHVMSRHLVRKSAACVLHAVVLAQDARLACFSAL